MKRKLLIFLTLLLFSALSQAQVYFKAYTGYSVCTNPEKLQSTEIVDNIKNVYQTKLKTGEGANLGFAIGYRFNKNLSFEITSNTQAFSKTKTFIPEKSLSASNNWMISGYFGDIKSTNTIFQFAPQMVYTIDYNRKLIFYIKAGPDFLLAKRNFENNYLQYSLDSAWSWQTHQIDQVFIEKGGINIGLQSSAGIEYKFSKNVHLTCEFISVICNYKFKTSETTKYTIDGVDHLSDLYSTTQKNILGTINDFSSCGINVGIKYSL